MSIGSPTAGRASPLRAPEDRARGSLIALCGTQGGVGVTTLTLLLGRALARRSRRRVLIADCGGPAAALAAYGGASASLTLGEASERLLVGGIEGPFVGRIAGEGVDVLARGASWDEAYEPAGLGDLLGQATDAYEAVLVDCGTLQREIERDVARLATDAVWVARADRAGALRAGGVLRAAPQLGEHTELLIARVPGGELPRSERESLATLAAGRPARLVLWADVPDPLAGDGAAVAGPALAALRGAVR